MEKKPHRSALSGWFVIAGVLVSLLAAGSAIAIDYDGNGSPDLLARTADGTIWRYSGGAGTAISGTARVPGSGWDLYDRIIAPGTWSADARPDVIGRARTVSGTGVYDTLFQVMGDGAGGFSYDESLLARGESQLGWLGWGWDAFDALIAPGDWDGDGSPDLLARTHDGRLVQYHRDLVCCPVLGIRQGDPIPYRGWDGFDVILGPGDWDGDGHVDLIVRNGGALFSFEAMVSAGSSATHDQSTPEGGRRLTPLWPLVTGMATGTPTCLRGVRMARCCSTPATASGASNSVASALVTGGRCLT